MLFRRSLVLATSLGMVGSSMGYDLVRDYSGQHFFDGWDFYGFWDNLTLSKFAPSCRSLQVLNCTQVRFGG